MAVFHFSDANSYVTAGDFSAVITWGDGTSSTVTGTASAGGQIVADASGGFDVLGAHDYTAAPQQRDIQRAGVRRRRLRHQRQPERLQRGRRHRLRSGGRLAGPSSRRPLWSLRPAGPTRLPTASRSARRHDGDRERRDAHPGRPPVGTGNATLLLDGGTLEAAAAFTSAMPIEIGAGGATVDTDGFNVTLAGNLSGEPPAPAR